MQDIKPDTSLYSDLPSRFRALALISEAQDMGENIQVAGNGGEWTDNCGPFLFNSHLSHYRVKPKPREMWKLCCGDAMVEREFTERRYAENYKASAAGFGAYNVVRLVEQPE